MKRFFSIFVGTVLYTLNASADNFVWEYYDPTRWWAQDPAFASQGTPTGVSDMYWIYTFDTKSCTINWTEWRSDGVGGEEGRDMTSYHNDVYLDNHNLGTELSLYDTLDDFIESYRAQAKQDVLILANNIINETNTSSISSVDLNRMTDNIVDNIFNGADITSTDVYNILKQNILALSSATKNDTQSVAAFNITKGVFTAINNQTTNRMLNLNKDIPIDSGVWVQGLTNYSKKMGDSSFDAYTLGIITGIDQKLGNNGLIGIGYAYNNSTAYIGSNHLGIDGHTVFVYGQYIPITQWHIDTILSVGVSSYQETLPNTQSNYNIYNFGAKLAGGYNWNNGWGISGGTRFLHTTKKRYKKSADFISQNNNNNSVLTLVSSATYNTQLLPELMANLHFDATYDMLRPDDSKQININGILYKIYQDNVKPFGIEIGFTFNLCKNNWDFDIGYNLELHSNFISHTGQIRAKYSF